MQEGSNEFLTFLDKFYEQFPEFRSNDFHLTGESYAGKYLPLFTHDILERNKAGGAQIPLKSTLIIDPYVTPVTQRTTMHLVGQGLNILDQNQLNQVSALEQHCHMEVSKDIVKARTPCNNIMSYIETVTGSVDEYNSMIFADEWSPNDDVVTEFF